MIFGSNQKLLMARAGVVPVDRSWDLDFATYNGVSFSVGAQETSARGVFFKPDGTKMYVTGFSGDDINEYDLSTPWVVSTASFLQLKSVAAQENFPHTLYIKDDGLTLFLGNYGPLGSSGIWEYSMSTAWDISTLSYVRGVTLAEVPEQQSMFFSADGLKFYCTGFDNFSSASDGDAIYQYTLATAWDITTTSYDGKLIIKLEDRLPGGITVDPTGQTFFVGGSATTRVFQYQATTAFDVLTSSLVKTFSPPSPYTGGIGQIFAKPSGDRFYIVSDGNDTVFQYDIG